MASVQDYLNLITSEFREKSKFISTVEANVAVQVRVQALLASMASLFDVDTALGQQLDVLGLWVGISRNVSIPIENVYFAWDDNQFVGWEYGTWQPSNAPATVTSLPDDAYRILIKAKIAANQWNGTTEGAYDIWETIFKTLNILIQDNQDMTYSLGIVGGIVDSLTLALIVGGYIPLKPEGVLVNLYYIPVNNGPLFAWDVESAFLAGWDNGSFARELSPT